MLQGEGQQVPRIKSTLSGARSMLSFTPANQLLLKIPKAPTDGAIRPGHPVNNWAGNIGEQLSTYKQMQTKSFLPQVQSSVRVDLAVQQDEIKRKKQFSTLNCEPYHREQKTDFGVCKLHRNSFI